jgi:hypothetical protein
MWDFWFEKITSGNPALDVLEKNGTALLLSEIV